MWGAGDEGGGAASDGDDGARVMVVPVDVMVLAVVVVVVVVVAAAVARGASQRTCSTEPKSKRRTSRLRWKLRKKSTALQIALKADPTPQIPRVSASQV